LLALLAAAALIAGGLTAIVARLLTALLIAVLIAARGSV